jgi:hypothetical protein
VPVIALLLIILIGVILLIWRSFLPTYVDGTGASLAAKEDVAGVAQSLIDARVEFAVALEQLRADLEGGAPERQDGVSKLHERREEALDGLYRRLVRTQAAFFPPEEAEPADEIHTEAGRAAQDLSAFFDENRPYYDPELVGSVGKLYTVLNEVGVALALDPHGENATSKTVRNRRSLAWQRARGSIREMLPELRVAIEARIRKLLDSAPPARP